MTAEPIQTIRGHLVEAAVEHYGYGDRAFFANATEWIPDEIVEMSHDDEEVRSFLLMFMSAASIAMQTSYAPIETVQ